jgi:hypothetical protein
MQRVPVLRQTVARAGSSPEDNPFVQALRHVGPGLSGTFQNGPCRQQAHPGGGGRMLCSYVYKFEKLLGCYVSACCNFHEG